MRIIQTITDAEFDRMLAWLAGPGPKVLGPLKVIRARAILNLGFDAGLRISEIAGLQWRHVGIPPAVATGLSIDSDLAKCGIFRVVPLTVRLRESLVILYDLMAELAGIPNCPWVIANFATLNHLTDRQIRRTICTIGEHALHRPINPHMLRHSFATRLARVTSIGVLQQLLGHKHLSSTQVYLHPSDIDRQSAIDRLN